MQRWEQRRRPNNNDTEARNIKDANENIWLGIPGVIGVSLDKDRNSKPYFLIATRGELDKAYQNKIIRDAKPIRVIISERGKDAYIDTKSS